MKKTRRYKLRVKRERQLEAEAIEYRRQVHSKLRRVLKTGKAVRRWLTETGLYAETDRKVIDEAVSLVVGET